jgi:hypothetical protein
MREPASSSAVRSRRLQIALILGGSRSPSQGPFYVGTPNQGCHGAGVRSGRRPPRRGFGGDATAADPCGSSVVTGVILVLRHFACCRGLSCGIKDALAEKFETGTAIS